MSTCFTIYIPKKFPLLVNYGTASILVVTTISSVNETTLFSEMINETVMKTINIVIQKIKQQHIVN